MNYGEIKYCDIANGEGVRTSLFVSGCTHHCKNCFNPETWDFEYGKPFVSLEEDQILESLKHSYVNGLTILGGEPMEPINQKGLVKFLERVRREYPHKTIWCYTGDTYEDLIAGGKRHTEYTDRIFACLDVLVDGPYIEEKNDITLRFRGSSNQRLIDMPATLAAKDGRVREWQDDPVYTTHTM